MRHHGRRLPPLAPLLIVAAALAAAVAFPCGAAGAAPARPQAVIVIADKLAVEDFQEFPAALEPLAERLSTGGAAGMMNVRTAAGATSANGYASLAAGARAAVGPWAGLALAPGETHQGLPAASLYESLTGLPPRGSLLHLGIGELYQAGLVQPGAPRAGLLGGLLKEAGLTAALLGDGDVASERQRYGALLVMDDAGSVLLGDAGGPLLLRDPRFPGGARTDYGRLRQRLAEILEIADVVAVDLGDLARLEAYGAQLSPARARALRRASLERIARFVRELLELPPSRPRLVYLVSPSPSAAPGRQGILLTPVFRWELAPGSGTAGTGPGLLTSATTRRPGLVANVDFLPAVLADLGLEAAPARGGRPWRPVAHPAPLEALLERYAEIKRVHLQRLPVIQPYFFAVLGLLGAGGLASAGMRAGIVPARGRWTALWRGIYAGFLAGPAALLLLPLFPPAPLTATWLLAAGLSLVLALGCGLLGRGKALRTAGLLGGATALLIAADTALQAPLMQRSLLGYDPVAGSRYYGIGNEYMGVLLGASLMCCAWLLDAARDRMPRARAARIPAALLAGAAFLMLHPRLGINVGGAISAGAAAFFGWTFAAGRRLGPGRILAFTAAAAAVLAAFAYLDSRLSGPEASHLGQVMQQAASAGADPLWELFGRKLAMNWRLIRLTVWSRVVFLAFALLAAAAFVPNRFSRVLARRFPGLMDMTKASVASALVALAVNDSGVVAASTLLLWPALTVLSVAPETLAAGLEPP